MCTLPPRRNVGRERPFGPSRAALSPEPGPVGGGVGPGSPPWPPLSDCFVLFFCPNPRKLFVIYPHEGKADPSRRSLPSFAEPSRRILASCELCSFSTERHGIFFPGVCAKSSQFLTPCTFVMSTPLSYGQAFLFSFPSRNAPWAFPYTHPTVFVVELLSLRFWTFHCLCKHRSWYVFQPLKSRNLSDSPFILAGT